MAIDTLEDLYLEQLKDLRSANDQAITATQLLAGAASDRTLSRALWAGVERIENGQTALAEIADRHEEPLTGAQCLGMEGLVREVHAHAIDEDFGDPSARDAMIITQYQRLVHYAIAGYGCLAAFADRLELDEDLTALRDCLDAFQKADRRMTARARGRFDIAGTD